MHAYVCTSRTESALRLFNIFCAQVFDAYSFYYRARATAALYNITETLEACVISAPVPVLPTDLSATEVRVQAVRVRRCACLPWSLQR